ncbi:hypothetical protein ACFQJ5_16680 [Halomicroarcula sp. GCM10025324]|uniref:hypothetical protein n=1 Tax=Haloarcula TaxID=2237 RepID=UPI0023E7B66D|nr:hypothetical protein [Halomicroarcula sp. ZS-22-S1]
MTGSYGSLLDYVRVYGQYGGTPPIPEWSDIQRGDPRPTRLWMTLFIPTGLLALLPVGVIASAIANPLATPNLWSLGLAWSGLAFIISSTLIQPVADWWTDTPRHGLETVEYTTGQEAAA